MISLHERMQRIDRIAILLSFLAVIACAFIADRVFEKIPHLEDEMTYAWQAQVIGRGQLSVTTPPCGRCFLVPFVLDYHGQRFGKYPLGWPIVLAAGVILKARFLVNPIMAGLTVWLTYLLIKKVMEEKTALLAVLLMITSPFFLMNSASLLPHPLGLFFTSAFSLAWIDTFLTSNHKLPVLLTATCAGFCLGAAFLTRPLTAIGVSLPFILHGIIILFGKDPKKRLFALYIAGLAGLISLLHFGWQYALTGDALKNPYTLWWPYDTIGFGANIGLQHGGYQLADAISNANYSLWVGAHDLFGWLRYSWVFLPIGLIGIFRNKKAWLVAGILPSLVLAYGLYWIGSWVYGPRYYYEALASPLLLTAAGIRWLAGRKTGNWSQRQWNKVNGFRLAAISVLVGVLISGNISFYSPQRIGAMHGLYNVNYSRLAPFFYESAEELTPALVIVFTQKNWIEYGNLLEISSPFLDSPFIITFNRGRIFNQWVIDNFPDRKVWYYYTDQPGYFYTQPR